MAWAGADVFLFKWSLGVFVRRNGAEPVCTTVAITDSLDLFTFFSTATKIAYMVFRSLIQSKGETV